MGGSERVLIDVSITAVVPKDREYEAIDKLLDILLKLHCGILHVDRDEANPNACIEAKLCRVIE